MRVPASPKAGDFGAVFLFLDRATPLRVECSWCGKELSAGREPVSHGICPECAKNHFGVDLNEEAGNAR